MPVLTPAELAAAPYSGISASQKGLDAASFRQQIREHGESFLWYRALMKADGSIVYVLQTLATGVKLYRYETTHDVFDAQGNLIPKGSMGIEVMPDEARLKRGDRIVLSDPLRAELMDFSGVRSADETPLPYQPVREILRVVNEADEALLNEADVNPDADPPETADYKINDAATGIEWLSDEVEEGERFGALYAGHWRWKVGALDPVRLSPIGSDGALLPQRWVLSLDLRADYE